MNPRFLPLALVFTFVMTVDATPPGWWSATNTRVLEPGTPAENYAPANLGQLKHVATQAKKHLDAALADAGGAGPQINALVASFEPRQGQGYTAAQIAAFKAENYAPINLGQLKAVAKPFYDRLLATGYPTKSSLIAHGAANWAFDYPWNTATPLADNYAVANLGQLKLVFSFEIIDTDGDGLNDANEIAAGTDPNDADSDNDGANDLLELLTGTDPHQGNPLGDSDGDGVLDTVDADPTRKDNPAVGLFAFGFVTP